MKQTKMKQIDQAYNEFCTTVTEDQLDLRETSIAKLSWLTGVSIGIDLGLSESDREETYIYCVGKMSEALDQLFAEETEA